MIGIETPYHHHHHHRPTISYLSIHSILAKIYRILYVASMLLEKKQSIYFAYCCIIRTMNICSFVLLSSLMSFGFWASLTTKQCNLNDNLKHNCSSCIESVRKACLRLSCFFSWALYIELSQEFSSFGLSIEIFVDFCSNWASAWKDFGRFRLLMR